MDALAGIDLFDAMRTQRTLRRLRPDPIPDDLLQKVLTAATWAPSGGNRQPWRFVAVSDPALKKNLRDLYAPHFAALMDSHKDATAKLPDRESARVEKMRNSGFHLADHMHEAPVIVVVCVHIPDLAITDLGLDRPSVVGGASIYPAVQNLLLACRAVGLGAALTTLLCHEEPSVRALLAIPADWATAAHVAIGYPDGQGYGPTRRKPVTEVAFRNRWDTPL
jgi:nitroreductase